MINITCAICGNNSNVNVMYSANFDKKDFISQTFSARRIPDKIHYQINKCNRCSLIFSSPVLSNKKIVKLYGESDFTYSKEAPFLADTYGHYLENLLSKNGRENIRLLDIGCGNGFFLEKVKSLGIKKVFGLEPGITSVNKAKQDIKKLITVGTLRPGLFKKNFFDVICCFHTLDHVINPNSFLQTVFDYLKPGGKVLFVTHNTEGLSAKLFEERSPIFDIEHIYLFNPATLSSIFLKNKFKQVKVYNLKNTYPILYWAQLTPIPEIVKKVFLFFLKQSKIGNLPVSIFAGNIAIIAEK